ncbi:MAG TPA: cysteine desulfurase family protein [Candidatus Moranbacteria bacterium]|nr:cysteine desulfurase family protein [Candidatus Moranbacteria bacterium]
MKIYLDYGATTPVDKKVFKAMLPYFADKYGNAMSLHSFGREANDAIEKARKQTADFFSADSREIIFTSGATESNNLVIKGVLKAYYSRIHSNLPKISPHSQVPKPHIITTAFEHHCILDACKSAEKESLAEITFISPDKDGLISAESVKKAIKKNTILVSVMYVNNEIGTVQPIREISKIVKSTNGKIIFHTDATQAINYFDCNVNKLGVDLLSMSAHKIYGPKGIGALYVRRNTPIARVQDGGDQEFSKRAGTHNVSGIVGLGEAISQLKAQSAKRKTLVSLRDKLIKKVLEKIPDAKLNGSKKFRSPNNANFTFKNIEGESLILMLDKEGIAASTGSACSTGSLQPSHVLLSIGLKPEEAHGSLRLTLGKHTTKREIEITVKKLKKVIESLRKISGKVLSEYYKNNKA